MTSALVLASIGLLIGASLHDMVARTIPNAIPAALTLLGAAIGLLAGHLPASLLLGVGVFAAAFLCWRAGWLGGADVKLFGAAALALPPASVPGFIAASAIVGGFLAGTYLVLAKVVPPASASRPNGLVARALRVEQWRIRRGGPLPYGCAIAGGFIFVVI